MKAKPKFKTRCVKCGKYDIIKYGWAYCTKCAEERRIKNLKKD